MHEVKIKETIIYKSLFAVSYYPRRLTIDRVQYFIREWSV